MEIEQDPRVNPKFESYPPPIRKKLEYLRKLIITTAQKEKGIDQLTETLKWGEPSYLVKKGSTIRMDWKEKKPDQYAMYFKCTIKLVVTFREVYGDLFNYENNRAIVFGLKEKVPAKELKECIRMALKYHELKNEPLLGMGKLD